MKASRGKTLLIIVLSLIVIVSLIAGGVMALKNTSVEKNDQGSDTKETLVVSEYEISKDKLLKDKYPEINALILKYRKALTEGDINTLKEVFHTDESINNDVAATTSQIIEGYSDTSCYTKKGIEENSYFVFIYDHLKIKNIETKVPNLTLVYVKTADDGQLYIDRGEKDSSTGTYSYDSVTEAYVQKLYEDAEVKDLMSSVYQEKEAACANDEALRNFIDGLSSPNPTMDEETIAESESIQESETN